MCLLARSSAGPAAREAIDVIPSCARSRPLEDHVRAERRGDQDLVGLSEHCCRPADAQLTSIDWRWIIQHNWW
jgi:hypothetical protein